MAGHRQQCRQATSERQIAVVAPTGLIAFRRLPSEATRARKGSRRDNVPLHAVNSIAFELPDGLLQTRDPLP
jgi:hypothetical protein